MGQHPGAAWLAKHVNRALINSAIYKINTRPYALSTLAPYTSWELLTDRTYTGRHLPPKPAKNLPPLDDVLKLFRRPAGQMRVSPKSTVLFSYFAQWFTDGFLRTDRQNPLRNTSNHEIDLCQLYGLTPATTRLVRQPAGRPMKSQIINGEEYALYYCNTDGTVKDEFRDLALAMPLDHIAAAAHPTLFAMGGDRANVQIGYVMMNTLILREHNRIAGLLAEKYPSWTTSGSFRPPATSRLCWS